jgi:mono/diheme cytochrome c family protein
VRALPILAAALVLALVAGVAARDQVSPAPASAAPAPAPAPAARPAASGPARTAKRAATTPAKHTFDSLVKPFVEENCASCHGTRRQKGGLNLAKYDSLEALTSDADRWEQVFQKLRDGDLPPV